MESVSVSPRMRLCFGNEERTFESVDAQLERVMNEFHRYERSMLEQVLDKFDVRKVSLVDSNHSGRIERTEVSVASWIKQIVPSPAPLTQVQVNGSVKRKSKTENPLRRVKKNLPKQSPTFKSSQPKLKQKSIDVYMHARKFRPESLSKK